MTISIKDYQAAIENLMTLAIRDTGGSTAAAQVLLSSYNGYDFQLSIPDLGLLDGGYFNSAIDCIKGRVQLMKEPHEVIDNGNERFRQLWEQWDFLKKLGNRE